MSVKQVSHSSSLSTFIDALKASSPDEPDEWLSPSAVSQELGMHINSIYRIIQNNELVAYNLVTGNSERKYYRIRRSDMENWLADRRTKYLP